MNILFGSAKDEAAGLLKRHGFKVLGKNQKGVVTIRLDGKEHLGELAADYTVEKNGRRYAVVTGVGDPTEPALRRQLIECDRVFGLDGVILMDRQAAALHEVSFKFPRERGLDFFFQFFIAMFILLAVIGIIWLLVAVRLF